jgi:hypothetical protein
MAAIWIFVALGYLLLYAFASVPATLQQQPRLYIRPLTMDSFLNVDLRQLDHLPQPSLSSLGGAEDCDTYTGD